MNVWMYPPMHTISSFQHMEANQFTHARICYATSILGLESFEMSSPNLASTASAPEGPDPSTQVANLAVAKIRIL